MSILKTGFVWHELYAWHNTGTAAGFISSSDQIQPHQHIESPDSKRRIAELIAVSGLKTQLLNIEAKAVNDSDLLRFHTQAYIDKIRLLSENTGGDAGRPNSDDSTPFGTGGFAIAALSAGGCVELMRAVWQGEVKNGYALTRPPGHHAEADRGRGFCIFANAVIAIKHLQAVYGVGKVAVVDWDVHHGNGTQAAFYDDPSVLTISLHQERNYPIDSGDLTENGQGAGQGCCLNIPLPAGSGHQAYLTAFDQVVIPAIEHFKPEMIVVCSGFDACIMDPLGRMQLHSDSYRQMTAKLMQVADKVCQGKLAMFHEGGYSEAYAPYCGLAVLEQLSGVRTTIADPYLSAWQAQPGQALQAHQQAVISEAAALLQAIPQ
ncbi:class II histone deacetylase [Neisseriaceae bacterium TC5R-5]|nr:class II histone deacetylase [Neisseriaceae bacterium TC5R-5]